MKLATIKPRIQPAPSALRGIAQASATDRIRGSALQTIRHRILTRDAGICRCLTCQRTGALKPAQEVEHQTPLWAGGIEDDSNRYAINRAECHAAKNQCEAAMRSRGAYDPAACTCGRHPT